MDVTVHGTAACWCGGELGKAIGRYYRSCNECGAAVLAVLHGPEHFDVSDDAHDFYGKRYWGDFARSRNLPSIEERVRSDLSERCLFWLERLLEVVRPPGRALEIGCGHGGFVRLLRELGFDAVGTELSSWVVEFAKRTFDVPVLRGRIETLDLEPGFTCIAAFDVLEHLSDPLEMTIRCRDLLAPEGVLLLQTPWYRGEGPDWSMFEQDEHIHLFTEASVRLLLQRAGFGEILVQPSLFPYDMWVVATRGRLQRRTRDEVEAAGDWRLPAAFQSLLDLSRRVSGIREDLAIAEVDRAARLRQVDELTGQVRGLDAARARDAEARREDVAKLTTLLREAEADRAARLGQMNELTAQIRGLEAARLGQVEELTGHIRRLEAARVQDLEAWCEDVAKLTVMFREAEADRAARLGQVEELSGQVRKLEAARLEDAEARREDVAKLTTLLREAEADRAARLGQMNELTAHIRGLEAARLRQVQELTAHIRKLEEARVQAAEAWREEAERLTSLLRGAEADRTGRLEQVEELTRLWRESEADRTARLEVIRDLEARIAAIEHTWVWRLYGMLAFPLQGRKPRE